MALSDDLGRAAGSGVPINFGGEDLVLPPITFEIIGEVKQWLLSQRKPAQTVLIEHMEALGDRLTPDLAEKMIAESMAAGRQTGVVSDEEFGAFIDTTDGLSMTLWLAFERRYPGKFSKGDVLQIIRKLSDDELEQLFRVRDQAAGLDEAGNSTGRSPEQ